MKTFISACFFILAGTLVSQAKTPDPEKDSIIVQFGNNARLVIHSKDKEGIKSLRNYDLNKIVRDMGAALDSTDNETYIYLNEQNGRKYLKDTMVVIQRQDGEIKISIKSPKLTAADSTKRETTTDSPSEEDDTKVTKRVTRRYRSPRAGFDVLLGLNAYGQNNPTSTAFNYNKSDYDLRPLGSRFVSVSWVRGTPISRGRRSSLGLDLGIDVSWYNLMFEGNNTVRKDLNAVSFPNSLSDLRKSKLTATYLNLSLTPTLAIHRGFLTYVSAGVYGGYRLDTYTKTQTARRGGVERNRSNFYMNDFRYGISAEVGIRHFPDLFMQYDMGELFQTNKGPQIRMVSFGLRI